MAEQQRPTSTQQVISTCPLCNIAHENPERETLPCGKHAFCSFCLELNVNLGPGPTKRPRLANITYKTVPCPACSKPADKAASDETWNLFSVPSRGHYAARRDGDVVGRTQYYAMNEYCHGKNGPTQKLSRDQIWQPYLVLGPNLAAICGPLGLNMAAIFGPRTKYGCQIWSLGQFLGRTIFAMTVLIHSIILGASNYIAVSHIWS